MGNGKITYHFAIAHDHWLFSEVILFIASIYCPFFIGTGCFWGNFRVDSGVWSEWILLSRSSTMIG